MESKKVMSTTCCIAEYHREREKLQEAYTTAKHKINIVVTAVFARLVVVLTDSW